MLRRCSAVVGKVVTLLALFTAPAMANHVDTATASVSCNSYTITLTASALNPGQSYTINFSITLTPSSGSPMTVSGSTGSFMSNSSGTFSHADESPGALERQFHAVWLRHAGRVQYDTNHLFTKQQPGLSGHTAALLNTHVERVKL